MKTNTDVYQQFYYIDKDGNECDTTDKAWMSEVRNYRMGKCGHSIVKHQDMYERVDVNCAICGKKISNK